MQVLKGFVTVLIALGVAATTPSVTAYGASHREAPLIALDPAADITDVYMFRSWVDPTKVVFIMNVIPAQEPSSGPNYFNFDDDVLYAIHLDVNADGDADDINYFFRFKTEIRDPFKDLPVAYAGGAAGIPTITALEGPGSEGLGMRQSYTVTQVKGKKKRERNLGTQTMFAVPSRIGSRTTGVEPQYEALAAQGIYPLSNGGRVFAGQRDETFYIDLGATFDTLNFRAAPILSDAADADDTRNPFGVDHFSGFNVNTIAIEVPILEITNNPNAVIGMYASTSRQRVTARGVVGKGDGDDDDDADDRQLRGKGQFVQVARMGNPLVNELVIGTGSKDRWNATDPADEAQFVDFYLKPRLVGVINAIFGTTFPTMGRTDLVNALLKYPSQPQTGACTKASPCSELLRVNLGVAPTQPAAQKRLGGLALDAAGFPNGRRPNDDVTDIVLRVAAGILTLPAGSVPNLGDGVNFNIDAQGTNVTANGIATLFPFLPTPHDGRDRRHIDCVASTSPSCSEIP